MLPGLCPVLNRSGLVTAAAVGTGQSNTSAFTTWTTGSITLGVGFIVVAFTALGGNSSTDHVTSMTINGVSASLLIAKNSGPMSATSNYTELWGASCSAASGVVSIVVNSSATRGGFCTYLLTGSKTTAAFTASAGGASSPSVSINCPAGGVIIAAVGAVAGSTSTTWTGLTTKDFDFTWGGGNSYESAAHQVFPSGATSQTVSNTDTGPSGISMSVAAIGPA